MTSSPHQYGPSVSRCILTSPRTTLLNFPPAPTSSATLLRNADRRTSGAMMFRRRATSSTVIEIQKPQDTVAPLSMIDAPTMKPMLIGPTVPHEMKPSHIPMPPPCFRTSKSSYWSVPCSWLCKEAPKQSSRVAFRFMSVRPSTRPEMPLDASNKDL